MITTFSFSSDSKQQSFLPLYRQFWKWRKTVVVSEMSSCVYKFMSVGGSGVFRRILRLLMVTKSPQLLREETKENVIYCMYEI